jgi:hypothetical protein
MPDYLFDLNLVAILSFGEGRGRLSSLTGLLFLCTKSDRFWYTLSSWCFSVLRSPAGDDLMRSVASVLRSVLAGMAFIGPAAIYYSSSTPLRRFLGLSGLR